MSHPYFKNMKERLVPDDAVILNLYQKLEQEEHRMRTTNKTPVNRAFLMKILAPAAACILLLITGIIIFTSVARPSKPPVDYTASNELNSPPEVNSEETASGSNINDLSSEDVNSSSSETLKIDDSKDWVYDAGYTYKVSKKSYTLFETTFSLSDIVVPYININSATASAVNKEIKSLYNDYAESFRVNADGEIIGLETGFISSYKKYINDDILSVVITVKEYVPELEYRYFVYNFNLKTGKAVSYKEIYQYCGFTSSNINSKVENAIRAHESFNWYTDYLLDEMGLNENDIENLKVISVKNYKSSVSKNTIKCFIDSNKRLNVVVSLACDGGPGELNYIITVK